MSTALLLGWTTLGERLLGDLSLRDFLGSWHSVLWIGMVVLVVAQAILARTRWSESRPLALCVTLSVLAHLLLIVYAYGARFGSPFSASWGPGQGETIVAVDLLDDEEPPIDSLPDENPIRPRTDVTPDADPPESTATDQPQVTREPNSVAPEISIPQPAERVAKEEVVPEPIVADDPHTTLSEATAARQMAELTAAADLLAASAIEAAPLVERAAEQKRPTDVTPVVVAVPPQPQPPHERHEPRRQADQQTVPKVYQNRLDENRAGLVLQFGGSAETEAAVVAALAWLVANQAADGRWDADAHGAGREARILGHDRGGAGAKADTGITGLALLALMAAGHTHLKGDHREAVQHGLEFLLRSQKTDGNLVGDAEIFARMYCHGIASLALSEAYAITGDRRLQPYVQRAVSFTLACQHQTTGGWRYLPGDTGDMSQFGWQVLALKSAELGGFEVPPQARAGMERFLESVTSGRHRGLASYRPGEQPSRTMTAEALVCRYFLKRCTPAQADEAVKYLLEEQPGGGAINFYYWYYATLALHQTQGEAWRRWNERLTARLLGSQRTTGSQAGSWDADPVWGNYGGRVFSTSLGALCLESYYRYLPLVEMASRPK